MGARIDTTFALGEYMDLFVEMFRSKASSADSLSPDHIERSVFEGSTLLW